MLKSSKLISFTVKTLEVPIKENKARLNPKKFDPLSPIIILFGFKLKFKNPSELPAKVIARKVI